jgi:hypothetical protein
MKGTLFAVMAMLVAALASAAPPLTFDRALELAAQASGVETATEPLRAEIAALRRARLPAVRAEVQAGTSRTLDVFTEGPIDLQFANSVLAFDYPIWGGGWYSPAQVGALEAKLHRLESAHGLNDAQFAEVLDAFGELYLTQRQSEILGPAAERAQREAEGSAELLSRGDISNLTAAERTEIALAFRSRLLEIESRRVGAAARLQFLTGLDAEPVVELDIAAVPPRPATLTGVRDDSVDAAMIAVEDSRARVRLASETSGFRAFVTGFAGLETAQSDFQGVHSAASSEIWGLRFRLLYPLIGGSNGVLIAEARAGLAEANASYQLAMNAARRRASEYALRADTAGRRMTLLEESVQVAKLREESLARLVAGGIRPESDLGRAIEERARREVDLLAAGIERWKMTQLLARMTAAGADRP